MEITKDKIENSFKDYIRGVPNSLPYPDVIHKTDEYKKNVAQKLIPFTVEKIPKISGEEFFASVKADGEYAVFYYDKKRDDAFFSNAPTHRIYAGLPVIEDLKAIMEKNNISSILVGGELIGCIDPNMDFNARCRVYDFIHFSRNPQTEEDIERIGFKAFDLLELEGKSWLEKPFKERFQFLATLFSQEGRASIVESVVVNHVMDIEAYFRQKVEQEGHEGIVVRSEGAGFKVKPIHTIDVVIVGVSSGREGTRLSKDQLSSSVVALRNEDGTYQILTRVGGGLSDDLRRELWSKFTVIPPKGYMHPTKDGRIFELVKPEVVAQIYYSDILTDLKGEPIMQNVIRYDEKGEYWEFVRNEPFVALISPRFVEDNPIRSDKSAGNIEDVRISQITELVEVPDFFLAKDIELKKSDVLARKVYEKGDEMVRKFILYRTNKEQTGFYPRHALYHLDYSENRKDPLSRRVIVTDDEQQAWELLDDLVKTEMIGKSGGLKRGWYEYMDFDLRNNE